MPKLLCKRTEHQSACSRWLAMSAHSSLHNFIDKIPWHVYEPGRTCACSEAAHTITLLRAAYCICRGKVDVWSRASTLPFFKFSGTDRTHIKGEHVEALHMQSFPSYSITHGCALPKVKCQTHSDNIKKGENVTPISSFASSLHSVVLKGAWIVSENMRCTGIVVPMSMTVCA